MKYIYCFTNQVNGKKYIGSTINTPAQRYAQHLYHVNHDTDKSCYPLYAAIKKYGIDKFTFEILAEINCSEQEIRNIERDYIIRFNSVVPHGYNQTSNTEHPLTSPETYAKMKETKRNNAKKVVMLDKKCENILGIYRSIVDCSEITGIDEKKIGACCRGERLSTNNHIFYWIDENDELIIPKYVRDAYKGKTGTTQIQSSSKRVAKKDLRTGEVLAIYDTIALAARENDCDASGISKVCRGKRNQVKGFNWEYVN